MVKSGESDQANSPESVSELAAGKGGTHSSAATLLVPPKMFFTAFENPGKQKLHTKLKGQGLSFARVRCLRLCLRLFLGGGSSTSSHDNLLFLYVGFCSSVTYRREARRPKGGRRSCQSSSES